MSKNRPASIFGALLLFSFFFGAFGSTAQAAINTSFSTIYITPNPSALNQKITIITTLSPPPPAGESFHRIQVSVIDINGNYRILGWNDSQPETGKFYFSWIPDIRGTYSVTLTYSGETLAGNTYSSCQGGSSFYVDPTLPTIAPTPIPTPAPTLIPTNAPPIYFPTETPNTVPFYPATEPQALISDLPIYIISTVAIADLAALMVIVYFKKKKTKRKTIAPNRTVL